MVENALDVVSIGIKSFFLFYVIASIAAIYFIVQFTKDICLEMKYYKYILLCSCSLSLDSSFLFVL